MFDKSEVRSHVKNIYIIIYIYIKIHLKDGSSLKKSKSLKDESLCVSVYMNDKV